MSAHCVDRRTTGRVSTVSLGLPPFAFRNVSGEYLSYMYVRTHPNISMNALHRIDELTWHYVPPQIKAVIERGSWWKLVLIYGALLAVSAACFPEMAVAILPLPVTVNAPPTLTDELSTAAPSHCSSRVAMRSRSWMLPLAVTLVSEICDDALMVAAAMAAITSVDPT